MPKLIKSYLDSLKGKEKLYEVWDTEIRGFGCRVQPSNKKTYYFVYRHKDFNKQRIKIGVHGSISCEIAREIARGWSGDLARGIDPKEHQKKQLVDQKQFVCLADFLDIYVEKYKKVHNKPSTLKRDIITIRSIIIPYFKEKKIIDISEKDILQFQDHLQKTPIQFNRCKSILSKAFSLAELWDYRPKNTNPCKNIKSYPEKKKERFLTDVELVKLDEVLKAQEILRTSSPYSLAAIRMLMYTGCRLSEILTLKWQDVFLQEVYLHLKDSKTGEKTIPLNQSATKTLNDLRQQAGNPFVFVGEKPGTCLTTLKTAWTKIRRLANLEDVRIHDLRHTFASLAIKHGVDLYTVSKLLGHRNIHTTTRYAHLEVKQLIKATNMLDQVWQEKA